MDTFLMSTDYDLISARHHFLTTDVVVDFCRYFADYLSGKPFDPPYLTQTHRPKCQYVFTSMEDAWGQYALEASNLDSYDRLCRYQTPLREAVSNKDDARTLELIDRIFSDKLIATNNREWLIANQTGLAELLFYACDCLTDPSPDYKVFGIENGPRMSATFSRIYAILIGHFISYESRVAAGLCYMIRHFCLERGIDLPPQLQLGRIQGWGKGKKDNGRNASWGKNVFPSIDTIKSKTTRESHYAQANILASWIALEALTIACQRQKGNATFWLHGEHAMRRIEAALYMIGAELPPAS